MRSSRAVRCQAALAALGLLTLVAAASAESPVADAAMRGDVDEVRELLSRGADVNAAQGDGMTALHWAAERGNGPLAEILLRAGAEPSPVTRIGHYTPLHLAARGGSAPVAALLLDAGSDIGARTSNSGATALHLAAAAGPPDLVQLLIDHGAEVDAREAGWGQTPLMFAAALERVEAVRVLLSADADPGITSEVVDLQVWSALDNRASAKQRDVIKVLTSDGARPPTAGEFQAAVLASREVYGAGLPEEEEDDGEEDDDFRPRRIQSKGGLTALLHAARQGHVGAALALVDGGADVDQVSAGDGTSPLLMAAINSQFDLMMELIERGADPNIASNLNGVTPLWAAVNAQWQPRTRYPQPQEKGFQTTTYLGVMEALLDAGADPNVRITLHPWYMEYSGCGNRNCGLVDTDGATAFWRAAYATDVDAMRLLIAHGADPNVPTRAPPRRSRLSPDEFLRQQNRSRLSSDSTFAELSDSLRTALMASVRDDLPEDMRVDFGDDRLRDPSNELRAELVAASERADSLRALEPDPSGLPPVPVGGPGVHPIHAASGVGYGEGFAGNAHRHAPDGWLPAVRFLVEELGVDVNARDHNGYNAIHHAAARGDDELILYLVEQGGDVTAVSRRGQTTADMANGPVQRVSPHPETVALLESLGAHNNHNCVTC